ncbi:MAG TPA: zinc-binding dehydrogenase [Chthoniobacterales bacterium]|jgi:threonine dehydrogenase-like Zn-dependent dehydrogenase
MILEESQTKQTTAKMTMRAAVLVAPGKMSVQEVPIPEPAADQVRIRVERCGVCASNIPTWEGRPWFTYPLEPGALGHEASGIIDALGENVQGWQVGQRVAALSYNGYAEYDIANANTLVAVPKEIGGWPFLGEPLGCALNIFKRSQIRAGQTVAIIGAGFLGALLIQLATRAGARVLALSVRKYSLDVAESLGAIPIPSEDRYAAIEQVKSLTNGEFCPVVIEATGKQEPLHLAGELTAVRGRLVIAGYHQDGMREINLQLWNWRGIDVINAHERDENIYVEGMREALAATLAGDIDPKPLVTHFLPLEELPLALELTANRPNGFLKAVVMP